MDCALEGVGCFVVARGYRSVLLELFKEVFDQMSCFVESLVKVSGLFPVCFRRDERFDFGRVQALDHPFISIVRLVRKKQAGLDLINEHIRPVQIAGLARCQMEAQWIAQCIA